MQVVSDAKALAPEQHQRQQGGGGGPGGGRPMDDRPVFIDLQLIRGFRCGAHAAIGDSCSATQMAAAAEGYADTQQGQGSWSRGGA